MLIEPFNAYYISQLEPAGFKVVNNFEAWAEEHHVPLAHRPALMALTKEDTLALLNLQLFRLFMYNEPICKFPHKARELLNYAARSITDSELVEQGVMPKSMLTSRWRRIFDIAEQMGVLAPLDRDRAKLVEYLQTNPEELRPYGSRGRTRRK